MSEFLSYIHCTKALSNVQCTETRLCVPFTVLCFEAIPNTHKQYISIWFQKNIGTFVLIHFPVHGSSDNKMPSKYLKLANQLKNTPLRYMRRGDKAPRNVYSETAHE